MEKGFLINRFHFFDKHDSLRVFNSRQSGDGAIDFEVGTGKKSVSCASATTGGGSKREREILSRDRV